MQRVDRIEGRRLLRWVESEEDSDDSREQERDGDGHRIDKDGRRDRLAYHGGRHEAEEDADHSSHEADDRGLDEKLHKHIRLTCSDGEPDPDLSRPLGHGDEHDVHDADAADEE